MLCGCWFLLEGISLVSGRATLFNVVGRSAVAHRNGSPCKIPQMDFLELDKRVWKLIDAGHFESAEAELHQARLQTLKERDRDALENVLSLMVELYCAMQPPNLTKAESCCLEREQISGTGFAKLQTAMMLYWSMDNPAEP